MRTTVDLPPAAHTQVRELAAARGPSMSAVIADLTLQGLARLNVDVVYTRDTHTGLPVISIGSPVTDADVGNTLGDE